MTWSQTRQVFTQEWRKKGTLKFQASICLNVKGVYLSITEIPSDPRSYSICIPESHCSSGWKAFGAALLQHSNVLHLETFLPIWNGRSFTRTILCKRRPENPPNRHYQRRTSTISLPWANPSQLFNSTNHRNSTAINKWERPIICEWINPPQVMEKTAIAIAKEWLINFIPSLLPFGDKSPFLFPNTKWDNQSCLKRSNPLIRKYSLLT